MDLDIQEGETADIAFIIDYFHTSTPEHLEMMGIDPTRLPSPAAWRERFETELSTPIETRERMFVVWRREGARIGFSTCDAIRFGDSARMHLHVVQPDLRRRGLGLACVRGSVDIYFERLRLKSLTCEPNAFNTAPNRTLQAAGFKYLKTHMTVPGGLNYHQAVTRWVLER